MTKKQALAMLQFISDLYTVIQAPDTAPAASNGNGHADIESARPMTVTAD